MAAIDAAQSEVLITNEYAVPTPRRWSVVGSTNLSRLSVRQNAGINSGIYGSRVGEHMPEMFAVDRADCAAFVLHERHARSPVRRVLMWLVA